VLVAGAAVATSALASVKWDRANAAEEAPKKAESLFVQTSKERSPEFARALLQSACSSSSLERDFCRRRLARQKGPEDDVSGGQRGRHHSRLATELKLRHGDVSDLSSSINSTTNEISALQIAPVPPAISVVVRSVVSEGEGGGFLGPFPRASQRTSMTPASPVPPSDLNRFVCNHRFHRCHVGWQRSGMERCGVEAIKAPANAHTRATLKVRMFSSLISCQMPRNKVVLGNPQSSCRFQTGLGLVCRRRHPIAMTALGLSR